MTQTAKLFTNGRSQAVRLPRDFRFEGNEVFIRKDPQTGDVILSKKPLDWSSFLRSIEGLDVPEGFLSPEERNQTSIHADRDPFKDWQE